VWPEQATNPKVLTGRDLEEAITPGTQSNTNLNEILARCIPCFDQYQAAGCSWIMRHTLEANYIDNVWLGLSGDYWSDPEAEVELVLNVLNYIQDFFRERYPEIIWGYSAAAYAGTWIPLDILYPGDDRIDLVGLSFYSTSQELPGETYWVELPGYETMLALGKPFVFWEWGASWQDAGEISVFALFERMLEYCPAKMISFWHSWDDHEYALGDYEDRAELLNDPRVIALPEWNELTATETIPDMLADLENGLLMAARAVGGIREAMLR